MRNRRRSAAIRLVVVLVVVLGAATYFLGINPLYNKIHRGLDLQGGIEVIFQATGTAQQPLNPTTLSQTVQVIGLRVNKLGVSEPVIQAEPPNRILVELAGVTDPNQALAEIGTPAVLDFKDSAGNIIVTGKELKSASAQLDPTQTPPNVVAVTFDAKGKQALAQWTTANQGKPMSIYLDGKLLEAPTILPGCCTSGTAIITGSPTFQAAQTLALELNSGALPLDLKILSKTTVSATLGKDSVRASMTAALVAMALVVAFMFLIYRIPGLWADLALLVYALLLMGVLKGINATLTLPGITGMILSIGMAVDSNVIIYERIREELRLGRSLKTAVDEGFRHGLRAILDSNTTTVIAAVVLYYLGSGLIRGFAVTVGIGVVISLLTAVVFTRYLLRWLVDAGSRPSWWFFAPRAALATAGMGPAAVPFPLAATVHGFGATGAGTERRRGARTLTDLRREWRPDIPVVGPQDGVSLPPASDGTEAPPSLVAEPPAAGSPAGEDAPAPEPSPEQGSSGYHRGRRPGKRRRRGGKGGR